MFALLLPVYALVARTSFRRALLTAIGLYIVFLIHPSLLLLLLLFWTLIWAGQRLIVYSDGMARQGLVVVLIIVAALTPMVLMKLGLLNGLVRTAAIPLFDLLPPILRDLNNAKLFEALGFSFATFRAVDLLMETLVGAVRPLSLPRVLFFGFFPAVQVVGPIAGERHIDEQELQRPITADDVAIGVKRIFIGLFKAIILSYPPLFDTISGILTNYDSVAPLKLWAALYLFVVMFYLNFAGYSDIAIGCARLYGFRLPENFDWPLLKATPSKFWASWHMSLTGLIQRTVFIAVGGHRHHTHFLAIMITMMVIALWHGISFQWVIFGLYHGVVVAGTRYFELRRPKPAAPSGMASTALGIAATQLYFILGFPIWIVPMDKVSGFYLKLLGLG
ncbi:MAG: hypothetical protein HQL43_00805 [Alphaproteobacteria bacterium]|nr:hypothetical protein [Alphaproteobacteria bacterium]